MSDSVSIAALDHGEPPSRNVPTPRRLHIIRFLLGIAEAGFFPGMQLYLTWWYPERYSSRMIAIL